jgi:hypothetical protein
MNPNWRCWQTTRNRRIPQRIAQNSQHDCKVVINGLRGQVEFLGGKCPVRRQISVGKSDFASDFIGLADSLQAIRRWSSERSVALLIVTVATRPDH